MSGSSATPLLTALAQEGLQGVSVDRLEKVAEECDARARETGDARYPVLEQVLIQMSSWWGERGGIPTALANEADALFKAQLPDTLAAESAAEGYVRATSLAQELRGLMTGPSNWVARGYLRPPPE